MDDAASDPTLARDIDAICRLSGEFTLRSGQVSSEYFDKYLFESQPALLARVAAQMERLLPGRHRAARRPRARAASRSPPWSARAPACRRSSCARRPRSTAPASSPKGPDVAGRRVTLVEDVITTGGAVRDATRALREAGAVVEVVVCAIDRSPAGENPLADVGLEVRPVAHQGRPGRRPRSWLATEVPFGWLRRRGP